MKPDLDKTVLPVHVLLGLGQLAIPAYQRPYKWGLKNISELFADIGSHLDKSAYSLGTVVFHARVDGGDTWLDIVDGQQRTLTLLLAVKAIIACRLGTLKRPDLVRTLTELGPAIDAFMARQRFASRISEVNLRQNYQQLRRLVDRPEFTEQHIDFLLHRCELVSFVLDDVSEAFQFFDSQNARGRDLAPHDLLKAYHLREFADHEEALKAGAVAHWERLQSEHLETLFASYLYRVRQWAEGKPARYFGKEQVDLFKGVNLDRVGHFPYVDALRIVHRCADEARTAFPFHLDQMIINGRRFFEMAEHYQRQVSAIIAGGRKADGGQAVVLLDAALTPQAGRILRTLNSYKRRTRPGDRYVRAMFDCALIFYIDKFGTQGLSAAVEKCFIWAYRCRLRQQVVQLATMDNYVLKHNLIRVIHDARRPDDIHALAWPTLTIADYKNNKDNAGDAKDELVQLFKEMKYYE
ncbi:DUF262 domain-containing protein [Duganella sp. HH101]|uniref:DUF262 domain-containing protein n=1 Tax=Duganella sp. HH101 TaxID=1781066 RepID=UPI000873731C|nr:DUF262 domain-containing protein [Duganella sp. HH101]